MPNKTILTLKDEKGRRINWQVIKVCKLATTIKKGTEIYLCKNSNRYNLIWRDK